jgi:hypothetical protein
MEEGKNVKRKDVKGRDGAIKGREGKRARITPMDTNGKMQNERMSQMSHSVRFREA